MSDLNDRQVFSETASGVLGAPPLGEGVGRSLLLTTEFLSETRDARGSLSPSAILFCVLHNS